MHRSSSVSRASSEFLLDLKMAEDDLPIHHHSVSDVSKNDKPPAQKAIHLIPLVLIFSGFILWIFSHQ
ncbi:hypothetical protein AAZX31_05G009600 [Glycine max]|nr:hypothetical protein GmHk_05G012057 [Glycine max]KHN27406.1 hypothetical protein glysoja_022115 [Glycine soja]